MRRLLVRFVVLGAVGVSVAAGVQVASAGGGGSSRQLVLIEKITSMTDIDLGPHGFGQGDRTTYTSAMLDDAGRQVGDSVGECVLGVVKGDQVGLYQCTATIRLADGDLTFQGFFDTSVRSGSVALTGGTGGYTGAGGTLGFVPRPEKDTYRDTIEFSELPAHR